MCYGFFMPCWSVLSSSTQLTEVGATNYTCRYPVGVAGLISPWNLPLYLLTFKIAPALAAGCTVVCKPSEMTSLTAYMLAKVMVDAGKWACFEHGMFQYRPRTLAAWCTLTPKSPYVLSLVESVGDICGIWIPRWAWISSRSCVVGYFWRASIVFISFIAFLFHNYTHMASSNGRK